MQEELRKIIIKVMCMIIGLILTLYVENYIIISNIEKVIFGYLETISMSILTGYGLIVIINNYYDLNLPK